MLIVVCASKIKIAWALAISRLYYFLEKTWKRKCDLSWSSNSLSNLCCNYIPLQKCRSIKFYIYTHRLYSGYDWMYVHHLFKIQELILQVPSILTKISVSWRVDWNKVNNNVKVIESPGASPLLKTDHR